MVVILGRMSVKEGQQPLHQLLDDLRMVVQLDGYDAGIAGRRIRHDVGEIAVEGNQNRAQFLGLGNNRRVGRATEWAGLHAVT